MNHKDQAYQLHVNGLSYRQIGEQLGISKTAAYEFVKEIKLIQGKESGTPVQNVSELEKDIRSEQKKNTIPNNSLLSLKLISERPALTPVHTSSELIRNDRSEHDNRQESKPEIIPERPVVLTPIVKTFSGDDLIKRKFNTYFFAGSKFEDLTGSPSKPHHGFIYGLPKGGKSYLGIFYADYFQEYHGRVLYIAAEEGESVTLQNKFLAINGSKVTVLPTRDKEVIRSFIKASDWKLVVIDSINNAGIDSEFLELIKAENPNTSTIAICQATKAGNFRGDQALTHNCDFIIEVVNGVAKHNGRFNSVSEIDIFAEPLYLKNNAVTDKIQNEVPNGNNDSLHTNKEKETAGLQLREPEYILQGIGQSTDNLQSLSEILKPKPKFILSNYPLPKNFGNMTFRNPGSSLVRRNNAAVSSIKKQPILTENEILVMAGVVLGVKILKKIFS